MSEHLPSKELKFSWTWDADARTYRISTIDMGDGLVAGYDHLAGYYERRLIEEIDRLNADLAWIRRRTQFWGEVPATEEERLLCGDVITYTAMDGAAQPSPVDPLGAETRAATSRDARSTEDAGRPQPSPEPVTKWTEPAKHCQNGGDVCLAGNANGICCPDDSCDIDDGMHSRDPRASQPPGVGR